MASTAVSTVPKAVTIIDRAIGIALAYRLDDVQAARALHLEVGDDEVGAAPP